MTHLPSPLESTERSPALDLVRGVAILGILPVNACVFAMPGDSLLSPWLWGTTIPASADLLGFGVIHAFFFQKFYPIFSMLFGAGILLQAARNEQRGVPALPYFLRRHAILLLFGALHVFFLWYGDILAWYALAGGLVYLLRNVATKFLLPLSAALLIFPGLFVFGITGAAIVFTESYGINGQLVTTDPATVEDWLHQPFSQQIMTYINDPGTSHSRAIEMAITKHGSWPQLLLLRLVMWGYGAISFALGIGWIVWGYMLLGLLLVRHGWLWKPQHHTRRLGSLLVAGLAIGIPLTAIGTALAMRPETLSLGLSLIPSHFGAIGLAIAYVAALALACQNSSVLRLTKPLRACGRMALTNYLAQSLILALLFQGWAIGLTAISYANLLLYVVLPIWLVQLIWSTLWLKMFKQGPMEGLWRRWARRDG